MVGESTKWFGFCHAALGLLRSVGWGGPMPSAPGVLCGGSGMAVEVAMAVGVANQLNCSVIKNFG